MDDYKMRLRLAKLIGLNKVPEYDPEAIKKLSGLLQDKINVQNIDAVQLVKEARERNFQYYMRKTE